MRLRTLSSGSSGNCYLLTDDDGKTLILDAGVKADAIKKALNFDFYGVCGVLITHAHKDHCLCADTLEYTYGLDVFRPYEIQGGRDRRTLGRFAVTSFDVPHDDEPCCGFFIKHIDGFKMLYLTDLEFCRYRFTQQAVNSILIEVNYEKEFLDREQANYEHKVRGHLSLENAIEFLKVNKTSELHSIVICHTSPYTLDVDYAVHRIERELNVPTYHAEKGKEIKLI